MVQHDGGLREDSCELEQLGQLWVVQPGLEAHPEWLQTGKTLAKKRARPGARAVARSGVAGLARPRPWPHSAECRENDPDPPRCGR